MKRPHQSAPRAMPRAIHHIWCILNAEGRGKITKDAALGAILHVCMRALRSDER